MYAALDKLPLEELYEFIKCELEWMQRNKSYAVASMNSIDDDNILKLLMLNNGCGIAENPVFHYYTFTTIKEYRILCLYACKANDVNKFFDYTEFFGTKYLLIFMDYFIDIDKPLETDDDIFLGRSKYFDAIRQIVDVFLATTTNYAEINSSILSTTILGNAYRFAGAFIAAKLIQDICGEITDNDQEIMKLEDLQEMLTYPLSLLLNGIKYIN